MGGTTTGTSSGSQGSSGARMGMGDSAKTSSGSSSARPMAGLGAAAPKAGGGMMVPLALAAAVAAGGYYYYTNYMGVNVGNVKAEPADPTLPAMQRKQEQVRTVDVREARK